MILITANSTTFAENWTMKNIRNKWKLRRVDREVSETCVQICFVTNNVTLVTALKKYISSIWEEMRAHKECNYQHVWTHVSTLQVLANMIFTVPYILNQGWARHRPHCSFIQSIGPQLPQKMEGRGKRCLTSSSSSSPYYKVATSSDFHANIRVHIQLFLPRNCQHHAKHDLRFL